MSQLDDAVDALTRERINTVPQRDDNGAVVRIRTVQLPPLLTQLVDGITSATGKGGGGGSGESMVINSQAFQLAATISRKINTWCKYEHVQPSRDMTVDLRRWHMAYKGDDDDVLDELQAWAKLITELFDPPKRLEVTEPCPVCGEQSWIDAEGWQMPFPLVIETHPEQDPKALCRACSRVWRGETELRSLRWELDARTETA